VPRATRADIAAFAGYTALGCVLCLAWLVPPLAVLALGYALLQ
jgi:hypothetical protein